MNTENLSCSWYTAPLGKAAAGQGAYKLVVADRIFLDPSESQNFVDPFDIAELVAQDYIGNCLFSHSSGHGLQTPFLCCLRG